MERVPFLFVSIELYANIAANKGPAGGQYRLKGGHLYNGKIKTIYLFPRKNEKVYLCFNNGTLSCH